MGLQHQLRQTSEGLGSQGIQVRPAHPSLLLVTLQVPMWEGSPILSWLLSHLFNVKVGAGTCFVEVHAVLLSQLQDKGISERESVRDGRPRPPGVCFCHCTPRPGCTEVMTKWLTSQETVGFLGQRMAESGTRCPINTAISSKSAHTHRQTVYPHMHVHPGIYTCTQAHTHTLTHRQTVYPHTYVHTGTHIHTEANTCTHFIQVYTHTDTHPPLHQDRKTTT